MSLFVYAYDKNDNGIENRLLFWLKLDYWNLHQAAMIITDIDPDKSTHDKNFNFKNLKTFKGEEIPEIDSSGFPIGDGYDEVGNVYNSDDAKLRWFSTKFNDLHRIFTNSKFEEIVTPLDWINKALSKQIIIPWLDFVTTRGIFCFENDDNGDQYLCFAKNSLNIKKITYIEKNSVKYPIELDMAIKAWQEVSKIEAKGKPKARIRKWLDENTNLSNEAKERISIVANWDKTGGATRSS